MEKREAGIVKSGDGMEQGAVQGRGPGEINGPAQK